MEIALRIHVVVWRISSNISGCTGLIFAIFSPNESVLGTDNRPRPLFSISQGTLPWQPILCKNGAKLPNPMHLSLWHSETVWDNAVYVQDYIAPLLPLHCVKF